MLASLPGIAYTGGMKTCLLRGICLGMLTLLASRALADQTSEALAALDEKVTKLNAQIEDLQVRYQQLQKELEKTQTELQEVRRAVGTGADVKALEERMTALEAARQKDRQAIIDQVAKELAGASAGKPTATGKEHVVQKGEYLSVIARKYNVSLADLKKANNLTGDDIKVGQKLVIPER
jgi:LysM repeat protein